MSSSSIKKLRQCSREIPNDLLSVWNSLIDGTNNVDNSKNSNLVLCVIEGLVKAIYGSDLDFCVTKEHFVVRGLFAPKEEYVVVNYLTFYDYVLIWTVNPDVYTGTYKIHRLYGKLLPKNKTKRRSFIVNLLVHT